MVQIGGHHINQDSTYFLKKHMINFYKFHKDQLDNHELYANEIEVFEKYGASVFSIQNILHIIKKIPQSAYSYATHVIGGRWKEAEPYIMESPNSAYWYAVDVIKGRWKEAEPFIKQSMWWPDYKSRFRIGKFE